MRESPGGLSMLKSYQGCPRRWAIKYLVGWRSAEAGHVSMKIGSALHDGIEVYLNSKSEGKGLKLARLNAGPENLGRINKVWYQWMDQWEGIFDRYELLAVEKQYDFVLENGFKLTLRVDRILRDLETGYVYIVDTKFTGWSLGGTEKNYMSSPQPLLYHVVPYFLETEWKNDFRGWITDIVYQRGKGDAQGLISAPVYYPQSQVEAYLESLTTLTGDMAYVVAEVQREPRNISRLFPAYKGNACTEMNSTCPYIEYCLECPQLGDKPRGQLVGEDREFIDSVIEAFGKVK